eukprot:CAMPEP_0202964424 /NCGR_PEP_ID=MMETSP1396-20130829/8506_1 /ASSEMBLY_ACC=CAM_ASM_000872 /TAXON_ID= /ORGANISM="Pseudokeronopsis sp., Strain Brazil" /LENGTH=106 /DNA_ID=CAMNT_0049686513 /DNA_START=75 /DNA_END=395 /DNA_ORIENTATION=-
MDEQEELHSLLHPSKTSHSREIVARQQPTFHEENKSFFQKCCSCCGRTNDLNRTEIYYYEKFKKTMVNPYDETNPKHEKALSLLYLSVFANPNDESPNIPEKLFSD